MNDWAVKAEEDMASDIPIADDCCLLCRGTHEEPLACEVGMSVVNPAIRKLQLYSHEAV
jgi:hypothetical protein